MGETRNQGQFKEQYENPALQEKGKLVLREFTRVVNTFNRALHYKEKQRASLIEKISGLNKLVDENTRKLQTVSRNIDVYNQNTQKVALTLDSLSQREELIKKQFELLLGGSHLSEGGGVTDISTLVTRESLIRRRKEFLDGLDSVFRQLEGELSAIDGIRKEMENARVEILIKKEEAIEAKELLEDLIAQLSGEVKVFETELGDTVKEERTLIKGFTQMIGDVEQRMEIGQDIDHLLFSVLAAGEADEKRIQPNSFATGLNGGGALRQD